MEKIKILIVDDHRLIRETWSYVLQSNASFEVVAACNNAETALETVSNLRPDIVLLDINLPGMNGLEATVRFRKMSPGSKILGLSMHVQVTYARQMLRNGAMGYITKNSSRQEMFDAIEEIMAGRKYLCKEIREILAWKMFSHKQENGVQDLSPREIEIIGFIKKGDSSKEIAQALNITVKTVEVHRYNILKKLKLKNSSSLVNYFNNHYFSE